MSFTQKSETNIEKCDGCEKHCALGWGYNIMNLPQPTIGGRLISAYYNAQGDLVYPENEVSVRMKKNKEFPQRVAVEIAQRIVLLCKNHCGRTK